MTDTTDVSGIADSVEAIVVRKGPGKQWAKNEAKQQKIAKQRLAALEEEAKGRKGPGPEWETNENGEYINRDEDE